MEKSIDDEMEEYAKEHNITKKDVEYRFGRTTPEIFNELKYHNFNHGDDKKCKYCITYDKIYELCHDFIEDEIPNSKGFNKQ